MLNPAADSKALAVAVFGLDDKAFARLELAMQKMGKGLARFVAEADSVAAIFNLDQPQAAARLESYRRQYPDNEIIILSLKPPRAEDVIFVKKPFAMDDLLQALRQVQKRERRKAGQRNSQEMAHAGISSVTLKQPPKSRLAPITPVVDFQAEKDKDRKFCGSAEDVDLADARQRRAIFYSPGDTLQGHLQAARGQARERGQAVIMAIRYENEVDSITLLPASGRALMSLDDKKLAYLCSVPLYCLEIRLLRQNADKTAELEENARRREAGSLDALLWKVALWSARGRLPAGTSLDAPVQLCHWPNFTRLHVTPGAFSIAALLHDKPMSLRLLLRLLAIPQRYLFAFCSAALALELLEVRQQGGQPAEARPRPAHPQRHLFGLIMQKLKRAV